MTKRKIRKIEQPEDMREVPLGTLMRDKITGWTGIAIGKIIFLNGCVQYSLKPQKLDKDGKTMDAPSFDCQQLEVIGEGIAKKEKPKAEREKPKKAIGGIMPDTPIIK